MTDIDQDTKVRLTQQPDGTVLMVTYDDNGIELTKRINKEQADKVINFLIDVFYGDE